MKSEFPSPRPYEVCVAPSPHTRYAHDMHRRKPFPSISAPFVIGVITLSVALGTSYLAVQQALRQGANDPQIQMAEDAARAMGGGEPASLLVPKGPVVDISKSLAPFLILYDDAGTPLASSGVLDGKAPVPPSGVFAFTRSHGEERVTWQPRPDVRIAAVLVHTDGPNAGFALAGRSLRETERRASSLILQFAAAWFAGIALLLAGTVVQTRFS